MREEPGKPLIRALRRFQRERLIIRARKIRRNFGYNDPSWTEWWVLRSYQHLARCSCWMCGNQRRYLGERTIQEQRHLIDDSDIEISDIEIKD
jgi:hypothetical protein